MVVCMVVCMVGKLIVLSVAFFFSITSNRRRVKKEMAKMVEVINENGEVGENGLKCITFGVLFILYQDISDTLVGILMRAKKYKKLHVSAVCCIVVGLHCVCTRWVAVL